MLVAVKLESVVDNLLQPLGHVAEEDNRSEGFKLGVVWFVGFGYDHCDRSLKFFWPDCLVDKAVEEHVEALQDSVRGFWVLFGVDEVFEVPPVNVVLTRGGH